MARPPTSFVCINTATLLEVETVIISDEANVVPIERYSSRTGFSAGKKVLSIEPEPATVLTGRSIGRPSTM
jgi:hypothetical protein